MNINFNTSFKNNKNNWNTFNNKFRNDFTIETDNILNFFNKKNLNEGINYIKINQNIFDREISNEEKKYLIKEEKGSQDNFSIISNKIKNFDKTSELKRDDNNLEKFSLNLEKDKTSIKKTTSSNYVNEIDKSNSDNKNTIRLENENFTKNTIGNDSSSLKILVCKENLNKSLEISNDQNNKNNVNDSIKITDNYGNLNTQSNENYEGYTQNDKSGTNNMKFKESENVTSPHISIDKILSKRTFENFNSDGENIILKNEEETSLVKRNFSVKKKTTSKE
jgi:hypothetical protein